VGGERGGELGIARLHVHRGGEHRQALVPLHHELVDAAELLLRVVLAGLREDERVDVLVDGGVSALQIDVLELVEGERLLDDRAHRRPAAPALGRDQVGVGELDLVLAGEETDLAVRVVGLVTDLPDLVRDPELEPHHLIGAEDRHGVLLVPVKEHETHVALRDRGLVLAGLGALAEGGFLEAVILRLLLLGIRLRDHLLVDELPAGGALVLLHQIVEIADEGVELRQTGGDVRLHRDRSLQVRDQTRRPLREGEALVLRHVHPSVDHEREDVRRHQDGGDDDQIDAGLGDCPGLFFHGKT
jgi:hypothetical protein